MVVEDIARIVECFENPTEPQRSITGIFNNLHSKGVPELLSASYHHLKVFFFFFVGIVEDFSFTSASSSSTGKQTAKQNIPVPV